MRLRELIDALDLTVHTPPEDAGAEVTGGYVGDLLSDVIGNTRPGHLWITIQTHPNIVAVAVLKDLAAVVLANGRAPLEETLRKARAEGVTLATSPLTSFELAGRLYEILAVRAG